MKQLGHALALVLLIAGSATNLSCNVNDYCLNCATGDGGPGGDALDGGDANDGGNGDATDAGPCVDTGPEVCDGDDNDCDGSIDEGTLPMVGVACDNQVGACSGGIKQCVNGAIVCDKPPKAELCDDLDNDCDNDVDEGDPGGGAVCGSALGECVAGTNHCVGGQIVCQGSVGTPGAVAETCNNRDDDCDGEFDEGIASLGPCDTGTDEGACVRGTKMCVGGATTCVGQVGPTFELCDLIDQDCDGDVKNGYVLATDPQNCGTCGTVCSLPHAFEGCASSMCTIAACEAGWHDNNLVVADGCEFGVCFIAGAEVCNGADDDCDGIDDDGVILPTNLCLTAGQCGAGNEQAGGDTDPDGSSVMCAGVDGFRCTYNDPDVSVVAGLIVAEDLCDGKDNDCDGVVDEGQPNLGLACDNGEVGDCRRTGTFVCNPAVPRGPAMCAYTAPALGSSTEVCDGRDNNCNGIVDDGAATGNLSGQSWVSIPGSAVDIMRYEASRPDATATELGALETHVCSRPGAQPWTNVTHPDAVAACAAVGARLCTETEWEGMCAPALAAPTYPVAGPPAVTGTAADYVFLEAEHAFATPTVNLKTFTTAAAGISANFSGTAAMQSNPDSGQVVNLNSAPAEAARLSFPLNLTGGVAHYVWVRILAPNATSRSVHVGINTSQTGVPTSTLTVPTIPPPVNAPMLNQWVWVRTAAITPATTATHFVNVFHAEDGVLVDAIAVTRSNANTVPPFDDKVWAYGTNPKFPQPQACNGDEYDTTPGGGDQDAILATGALAQCFANGPGADDAFDMSGNVKEWTVARSAGQNPIRGGSSNNEVDGLACGLDFTLADDAFFFPNVGFRCCRD